MSWTKGKYVVGEVKTDMGVDLLAAILIPEYIPHSSVKDCFGEIQGAGFFTVSDKLEIFIYGESVGLGVKSRPEDQKFIADVLLMGEKYRE